MTALDISPREIQEHFVAVHGARAIANLCIDKMEAMEDDMLRNRVAKRDADHNRRITNDFFDVHMALETIRAQLDPVTQFLNDLNEKAERDG